MDLQWHAKELTAKLAIRLLRATGWYSGYWNHWRGSLFNHAEQRGLHILPTHFYTPIPEAGRLPESLWEERPEPPALALETDRALALLTQLSEKYRPEFETFSHDKPSSPDQYSLANPAYSCGDAEVLYSMIRHTKPRRIIEVGSGYTTLLTAQAIRRNLQEDPKFACEFIAIEPYPPDYLKPPPVEVTRIVPAAVQQVPLEQFTSLQAGDILFIDSSHVVAIGSDVIYEVLEILPRLNPGVVVHFHDIFIPGEYPRVWIHESRYFWNEQYLLQAFLQFNQAFEVLIPLNLIFRRYPQRLEQLIPSCRPEGGPPSAFWIRRLGGPE